MVATDGVFDNLPDSLIVKEMVKVQGSTDLLLLQQAANSIAQQAQKLAFDEDYMSPFARSARENGINAIGKYTKGFHCCMICSVCPLCFDGSPLELLQGGLATAEELLLAPVHTVHACILQSSPCTVTLSLTYSNILATYFKGDLPLTPTAFILLLLIIFITFFPIFSRPW